MSTRMQWAILIATGIFGGAIFALGATVEVLKLMALWKWVFA